MAKDLYHEVVKEALVKDGWKITHDPYKLEHFERKMEIDIGAEKLFAAEKGQMKIAIEIKSFLSHSRLYDYHLALGQYKTYKRILQKGDKERLLYLAVPSDAYTDFFASSFGQEAIREEQLRIFVYKVKDKSIVKWIN